MQIQNGNKQELNKINWVNVLDKIELRHNSYGEKVEIYKGDGLICTASYADLFDIPIGKTVSNVAECLPVRNLVIGLSTHDFISNCFVIIEARDNYETAMRLLATALIYMYAEPKVMIKRAVKRKTEHAKRELSTEEVEEVGEEVLARLDQELFRSNEKGSGRLLSHAEAESGMHGYHLVINTGTIKPITVENIIMAFMIVFLGENEGHYTYKMARFYLGKMRIQGAITYIDSSVLPPEEGAEEDLIVDTV